MTTGRTVAFAACTPEAISSPQIIAKTGLISLITLPLAAKRIAPAAGRMNVWMTSLAVSAAGILSTVISIANSTPSMPNTQGFSNAFHGA